MEILTGREQFEQKITELTETLGRAVLLHYGHEPLEYIEPEPDRTFTATQSEYVIGDHTSSIQAYSEGLLDAASFMSLGTKFMGIHVVPCGEHTFTQYLLARDPELLRSREGYVHAVDAEGFSAMDPDVREDMAWLYEYRDTPKVKVLAQARMGARDLRSPVITVPDNMTPSQIFMDATEYADVPHEKLLAVAYEDDQVEMYTRDYLVPNLYEESVPCRTCNFPWYAADTDPFDAIAKAAESAAICSRQHE
jgi:hypothetical protein